MLPLLETLSKIFNRNAVKGRQRFSLNRCNVSKTPPFQNLLHPWVQKKLQGARSGEQGWWDTTTILILAKRLCGWGHCHGARTIPHSAAFLDDFIAGSRTIFSTHSSITSDLLCVLEKQTPCTLSHQHQKKKSALS